MLTERGNIHRYWYINRRPNELVREDLYLHVVGSVLLSLDWMDIDLLAGLPVAPFMRAYQTDLWGQGKTVSRLSGREAAV